MVKHILDITRRITEARVILNNLLSARDAMRLVCDHDDKYQGHGHNESYYECTKCGREYSE